MKLTSPYSVGTGSRHTNSLPSYEHSPRYRCIKSGPALLGWHLYLCPLCSSTVTPSLQMRAPTVRERLRQNTGDSNWAATRASWNRGWRRGLSHGEEGCPLEEGYCDRSDSPHRESDAGKCANPPSSRASSCPTTASREMEKNGDCGFSKPDPTEQSLAQEQSSLTPQLFVLAWPVTGKGQVAAEERRWEDGDSRALAQAAFGRTSKEF